MLRLGTTNLKHNQLIYTTRYYKECIRLKLLTNDENYASGRPGVMALECGTHKKNGHFHSLTRPCSQNINCINLKNPLTRSR